MCVMFYCRVAMGFVLCLGGGEIGRSCFVLFCFGSIDACFVLRAAPNAGFVVGNTHYSIIVPASDGMRSDA